MKIEELQHIIYNNLFNKKGSIDSNKIQVKYLERHLPVFYKEVLKHTQFLDKSHPSFQQRLYHIYHNFFYHPTCNKCKSTNVSFIRFNKGYYTYCSVQCASDAKNTKEKRSNTCKDKYGCSWPMQSKEIYNKSKETIKAKYNVDHISQTEHVKNSVKNTVIHTHKEKMKKLEKMIQDEGLTILEDSLNKTTNKMGLVKLKCKKGHIFERIVNSLWYNLYCPQCSHESNMMLNQEIIDILSFCEDIRETEDNQIEVRCTYCGEWHIPERQKLRERIRYVESGCGYECRLYCSQQCKDECPIFGQILYPKDFTKNALYSTSQYNFWRKAVLERENYICEYCEGPANTAHHEYPQKLYPELALDPDNGVACCVRCHYEYGHKTGTECSTGNLANKVI